MEIEERSVWPPCRADGPYPEVRAAGRNPRYAEMMLCNMGGSNSELSLAGLYFYDHLITAEYPELSELFRRISAVEMEHLEIFGTLARQLGADPRFWCRQGGRMTWWTPAYLHYSPQMGPLIQIALREEEAAARKYEEQACHISDRNVAVNLLRIARDECCHAQLLRDLLERYKKGGRGIEG